MFKNLPFLGFEFNTRWELVVLSYIFFRRNENVISDEFINELLSYEF
jgi:hypothetical protein